MLVHLPAGWFMTDAIRAETVTIPGHGGDEIEAYLAQPADGGRGGQGAHGWFAGREAIVYLDHPGHAPYGHTVNIDVLNPALGPSARVALELTEETTLALAEAIQRAIGSAPAGIASADQ
jgi:Family of unknown function (DUF6295)